jgi:type I restriction enzyme S subunit
VVEFGTVCDVQLGKMLSPKSKVGTRPVPYLRNENVQWARFDLTDVSWMDFTEAEERKFRLEPGDLLACEGGEPGRAAIWQGQIARCCYQKALHRIRPRAGLVHPPFVLYRLWLSSLAGEFTGSQTQTTIAHLPREKLIRLSIPLPPLAEQERIAAKLTEQLAAVDRAREAAQSRLAAAEALPAALLREVFEGPEASGWEAVRLGSLLRRYNEIIHPGDRKSGEAVFVGLEHIESHTGRRIGCDKVEFASLTGRKPTFKRGQIVYGYLRPYLNKVWIADFDGCSSVDQFAFDVNPELADTTFVAAFMRSATFLRRAQGVTTTGQLPRISIDEIAAVDIELPPNLATQNRIAAELTKKLTAAEGLIARCREELAAIEALPAALLRQAFGGTDQQGD